MRTGVLLCLLPALTACDRMDCNVNKESFRSGGMAKGTQLGSFSFNLDATETEHPYIVPVKRVEQGYALQAPLYNDESVRAHMEVSKTADMHWFIGPKLSWSF